MTLSTRLGALADRTTFAEVGTPDRRWGQLLREGGELGELLDRARSADRLVPLRDLVRVRGGVVTRANAYFLLEEIPFSSVPGRFRLTRADYRSVALVKDGLDTVHRIEREYLRPILKGPEALVSPTQIAIGEQRVFAVNCSEDDLRERRHNGASDYVRRGRTQSYEVSSDRLKGGIPAERANIVNRRPFWYSLSIPEVQGGRIVFPEHVDRRYPVTYLDDSKAAIVVIDKIYVATPLVPENGLNIAVSLNSLLTWAQLEIRGRTQLGQGVLEVKKPDWEGILVLRPDLVTEELVQAFAPLSDRNESWNLDSIADPERVAFDEKYLAMVGVDDAQAMRQALERHVIAAVGERSDRRESVNTTKGERGRQRRVSASVDAYASRIAARLDSFPDPRNYLEATMDLTSVPILGSVTGNLTLGDDLFTFGWVFADGEPVAETGDPTAARFVRAVLVHDPELTMVEVPAGNDLATSVNQWDAAAALWYKLFERVVAESTTGIADQRTKIAIRGRALQLLHAVED